MPTPGIPPVTSGAETVPLVSETATAVHTDRDAFSLRLQHYFHRHAVTEAPFLLLALRGDDGAALDLRRLVACLGPLLGTDDDWLVDLARRRLIVVLAGQHEAEAHRFFARLKQRLLHEAPVLAEAYLHGVTAIVLANGGHFHNAEEFLSVALEEV